MRCWPGRWGRGRRVSEKRLLIETEEGRDRLYEARRRGEICAGCGRALGEHESVYWERFEITGSYTSAAIAPVGAECASLELLQQMEGTEPERCASCGRGVFYRSQQRSTRRQAACSRRCATRAGAAERAARATGES